MPKREHSSKSSDEQDPARKVAIQEVSSNIYYNILCVCLQCSCCFKSLIPVSKLPDELLAILEKLRPSPTSFLRLSEWERVGSPSEIYERLAVVTLMNSQHKCFSKIALDKLPNVGWDWESTKGRFESMNMYTSPGREQKVVPILHKISTAYFAPLDKRSVLLDVSFVVSMDMLNGSIVKKKRAPRKKKESISLEEAE